MKSYIYKLLVSALVIFVACGDDHQFYPKLGETTSESIRLRFVHAASDTVGVNLFADDIKISGGSPSVITSTGAVNVGRIVFGGDFPVTGYASAGNDLSGDLEVSVPVVYTASDTFPSKTVSAVTASLDPSKWYTVALVGVTSMYETVVYEDNLTTAPLDGKAYIRFANFIDNVGADELKLVITPPAVAGGPAPVEIELFTDVSYKEMTGFIALPQTGVYTNMKIINETTGTTVYTLTPSTSSLYTFTNNKVYTVFAKGRIGGAGAAAPGLGRMANR